MVPLRKEALALSGSLNTWRKLFSHWDSDSDFINLELPEKLIETSHQSARVSFAFAVADALLTRVSHGGHIDYFVQLGVIFIF